jgi:hypothetical protein
VELLVVIRTLCSAFSVRRFRPSQARRVYMLTVLLGPMTFILRLLASGLLSPSVTLA